MKSMLKVHEHAGVSRSPVRSKVHGLVCSRFSHWHNRSVECVANPPNANSRWWRTRSPTLKQKPCSNMLNMSFTGKTTDRLVDNHLSGVIRSTPSISSEFSVSIFKNLNPVEPCSSMVSLEGETCRQKASTISNHVRYVQLEGETLGKLGQVIQLERIS